MVNLPRSEDVSADNERSLKTLVRAISLSKGRFSLILVHCNYRHLRERMLQRLRELSSVEIKELVLPESARTLYQTIQTELKDEQPPALMVLGLEVVTALDDLLISTNRLRDEFRKSFPFPLVLWVNDEILKKLIRLAPDFENWAGGTILFALATDELIDFLQQEAKSIFAQALNAGAGRFPHNLALNQEIASSLRSEVELAQNHLQSHGQELEPALEASLQFILGRDAYANTQMNHARRYYEKSLALLPKSHHYLEQQACLLFYLGLWWRRYAVLHWSQEKPACGQARDYYQQCVEKLRQANRPDLEAKFINALGEVLQRLEQWNRLKTVAEVAIKLHQTYPDPIRLAYSYGLLADAARENSDWTEAKRYAEAALQTNGTPPESAHNSQHQDTELGWAQRHYRSFYLLLLAQSQQHLDPIEEAIKNLKSARDVCNHSYDPQLYIRILEALRSLYYKQGEYLKAFQIKREQRSIEQQYGMRAFIGAGRLQPQRQVINPALVPVKSPDSYRGNLQTGLPVHQQMTVAQEIEASGRQQDITDLIKRISRNDYKLTIIHGQSGVGKSSIVNAGLVPALKQHSIEASNALPIVLRVYTDWVKELGKCLAEALEEIRGVSLPTVPDSPADILEQLRNNDNYSLLTVLIFDQFEEFFFVFPNQAQQRPFFDFFRDCLNIPYVKVILSLREDYLHYLLVCERLHLNVITENILDRNKRYPLGNFSATNAKQFIERLTQRSQFKLQHNLIEQLVKDLAKELEEVRPIELQVVGFQLEEDKITKLEQYKALGDNPKEKLVERFLNGVIEDCGSENKQAANLILYSLTDEQGNRPLKTLAELSANLLDLSKSIANSTVNAERLHLILQILVKSGLVLLLAEIPAERYQLVHDYLATLIRQKQGDQLNQIIAQLKEARENQEFTQKKLAQARKRAAVFFRIIVAVLGIPVAGLAIFANSQLNLTTIAHIEATIALSSGLLRANDQLEAFVNGVKAGEQLQKQLQKIDAPFLDLNELKIRTTANLLEAVYTIQELKRLLRHSSWVNGASFSPNGELLASASADNTIILWDANGQYRTTLKGHSNIVTSVNFSPNGQLLASASSDLTIKLWSLDGNEIRTLRGHSSFVTTVSFSPVNQLLASASDDGTVKLWRLDGKLFKTLRGHTDRVKAVSFSPDGKALASASWDNTVKLWSVDSGKEFKTLPHENRVTSVSFSPDGKTIASGSWDNTVKLWSLDGELIQTLRGHTDRVISVGFSPDGHTVVSASNDGTVKLWNLDGIALKTLKIADVTSVSFSPNGKTLISTSADNTVRLWDLNGISPTTIEGHNSPVTSISFSPDSKLIASAAQSGDINLSSKYSAERKTIDGQVKLWSFDGKEQKTLPVSGSFARVKFSPDGRTIAIAGKTSAPDDKTNSQVKLLSLNGKELRKLPTQGEVTDIGFSSDGKTIAIAENNVNTGVQETKARVKLWSLDGKELKSFPAHNNKITSVSFSPTDSRKIAFSSDDKTVQLWSRDGELLYPPFKGHTDKVTGISFSPNGKTIASASADTTIKLWSLDGIEVKTLTGHTSTVNSVNFSPDGKMLISGADNGTIKIWNPQDGTLLATLKRNDKKVSSVSFSPDGLSIASGGIDNTVSLWKFDLKSLLKNSCDWLQDYPKTNKNEADDNLCSGVVPQK